MGLEEIIKSIGGAGILVVLSAAWIYKALVMDPKDRIEQNKLIERVSGVIANNTEVIRETKSIHKEMEKALDEIKTDIKELKSRTDQTNVQNMLERIEDKIEALGK